MGLSEFKVVFPLKGPELELHVFEGPSRNKIIPVERTGLGIGRDPQNTFCVSEDSQMSNFHAKITSENAKFYLVDVGSTNRTWQRLSAEGEQSTHYPLSIGDVIKIGSTVFLV